jgi:hypothetical protein
MAVDARTLTHITFATRGFHRAIAVLKRTARRHGVSDLRVYGPEHPAVVALRRAHPAIMKERRGAGYWLWKPAILLDAMASLPDGVPILYTDAGLAYENSPAPLLSLLQDQEVVTFSNTPDRVQRLWTKRDCFVLLDADRPEEWERRQLDAAVLLMRNGPRARALMAEWATAMRDPRTLTDQPNQCGLPNLAGFIEHRHDQSVLTIVAARNGVPVLPMPMSGRSGEVPYGAVFLQHRLHARRGSPFDWLRLAVRLRLLPFG